MVFLLIVVLSSSWHSGQSMLKEQRQNAVAKAKEEEERERWFDGVLSF